MKIGKIVNIRKAILNFQRAYDINGIVVVPTRTGKPGFNLIDKTEKKHRKGEIK